MKVCFKCKIEKELSCFYKHKVMKDGHLNKCKECSKKDIKKNTELKSEYYRLYDKERSMLPHRVKARKEYSKSEKGKEIINRAKKKWKQNNIEKIAAHTILGNRLAQGRIMKKDCESCGEGNTQAHHHDYSKPLDVVWLCSKCHSFKHKIEKIKNRIGIK